MTTPTTPLDLAAILERAAVIDKAPGPMQVELVPNSIGSCYKFTPGVSIPNQRSEFAICLYVDGMRDYCKNDLQWVPYHDAAKAFVTARNDAPKDLRALVERVRELEAKIERYGALAVAVVPGPHGSGEEIQASPEHLRAVLEELQREWDSAEKRFGEANREIARLRSGGCARDQGLTQYCAEAVEKDKEIARLRGAYLVLEQEKIAIQLLLEAHMRGEGNAT